MGGVLTLGQFIAACCEPRSSHPISNSHHRWTAPTLSRTVGLRAHGLVHGLVQTGDHTHSAGCLRARYDRLAMWQPRNRREEAWSWVQMHLVHHGDATPTPPSTALAASHDEALVSCSCGAGDRLACLSRLWATPEATEDAAKLCEQLLLTE